jgi:putative transposase
MGRFVMRSEPKYVTAQELCSVLGISKGSLYVTPSMPDRDLALKARIVEVIEENPTYGHKRIALDLARNKKAVLRVMKKHNIKPTRYRAKKPNYSYPKGRSEFENVIQDICPIAPYAVLATDFTYLPFKGSFLYLATVLDIFNREIIGYALSTRHTQDLVVAAIRMAVSKCPDSPLLIHFDQGSEYLGAENIEFLKEQRIQISVSAKGHPWENGYKEAFYSQFKLDLDAKHLNRFATTGEVAAHVYRTIFYHNNKRIHTSLKTNPVEYKKRYYEKLAAQVLNSNVHCTRVSSKKTGT